jgi:hypothetical protein
MVGGSAAFGSESEGRSWAFAPFQQKDWVALPRDSLPAKAPYSIRTYLKQPNYHNFSQKHRYMWTDDNVQVVSTRMPLTSFTLHVKITIILTWPLIYKLYKTSGHSINFWKKNVISVLKELSNTSLLELYRRVADMGRVINSVTDAPKKSCNPLMTSWWPCMRAKEFVKGIVPFMVDVPRYKWCFGVAHRMVVWGMHADFDSHTVSW